MHGYKRNRLIGFAFGCLILTACPPASPPSDPNAPAPLNAGDIPPPGFRPDPTQDPPASAVAPFTLLNEIVFDPEPGQSQFVELKIGADDAPVATLKLVTHDGREYPLPADSPQTAIGGFVLIRFDGAASVTEGVIHADRAQFLDPKSGSVSLVNESGVMLDTFTWGADRAGSVRLGNGGVPGSLPFGTVFARLPASVAPNAMGDWVTTDPLQSTPGGPNRNPAVETLLPLHGALVESGDRILTWYPVAGAAQYRVQLARDDQFTDPALEQTVDLPVLHTVVDAGDYFWRVQAIMPDGSAADFSASSGFTATASFDDYFAQQDAVSKAGGRSAVRSGQLSHVVPLYAQRKDTHMLLLESDREEGAHAWNVPHEKDDHRFGCPADNTNCSLASISMVNGFFAGSGALKPNLSQDRIGLAVYSSPQFELHAGPEQDLNFFRGLQDPEITFGLNFALGITPQPFSALDGLQNHEIIWSRLTHAVPAGFVDKFFADVQRSIGADKPVLFVVLNAGAFTRHAMVATRWAESGGIRWIGVNDPWPAEFRWQKVEELLVNSYWILPDGAAPRGDESDYLSPPGDENDGDKDRVSNFDETVRFRTDPLKKDSDDDCVEDFDEIRSSVFDPDHGWGPYSTAQAGGSSGSDGKARAERQPERTNDSDGDGIPDFVEDLNRNGIIEPEKGESNPFERDGPRKLTGTLTIMRDQLEQNGTHIELTVTCEHELETTNDGKPHGMVRFKYNHKITEQLVAAPPSCPQPRTRVLTYDELIGESEVDGEFLCSDSAPGPHLRIVERDGAAFRIPAGHPVRITDPCLGGSTGTAGAEFYPYVSKLFPAADGQFNASTNRVEWKATATVRTGRPLFSDYELILAPK